MFYLLLALVSAYIAFDYLASITSNKVTKADARWAIQHINGAWQEVDILKSFHMAIKQCFNGEYEGRRVIAGYLSSTGIVSGTFVAMNLNCKFNDESLQKNPAPTDNTEIIGEWLFYYNIYPKIRLSAFRVRKKDVFDKVHFAEILKCLESTVIMVESKPEAYHLIGKD